MDPHERQLLDETVRDAITDAVVSGADAATLDKVLTDLGWLEMLEAEPRDATAIVFTALGLTNGDLFSHVIAFSPGFMVPKEQRGRPEIYVSHGKGDQVLPIDSCSRGLVPRLRSAGYEVLYREFDGPHAVPEDIAREALEWFTE